MCEDVCTPKCVKGIYTYGNQRKMVGVMLYHFLSSFCKTESFIEPRPGLLTSKPQHQQSSSVPPYNSAMVTSMYSVDSGDLNTDMSLCFSSKLSYPLCHLTGLDSFAPQIKIINCKAQP